jgi:superfamily II DNA or RNA helicase
MTDPRTIQTSRPVVPMIYAYSTPEIKRHDGWLKIGFTEQEVDKREYQQGHTIDVIQKEEWRGNAMFDDGSGDVFMDHDFHAYLRKMGIENIPGTEWYHITVDGSRKAFEQFRQNRGYLKTMLSTEYTLRDEQEQAVEKTLAYAKNNKGRAFLWNAKPRFGKTLAAYDFCKRYGAENVLIVTNRPSIANSWYSDYIKFMGDESGYYFVSDSPALADSEHVMSAKQYQSYFKINFGKHPKGRIEFVSLQDLKGAIAFGGQYDKLNEVSKVTWDVLIVDEAHEGVDTYKTDIAFDHIKRSFTLHLSGTPFKALANDKFPDDAIFNWTYADEQAAKRNWNNPDAANPYATLPQLNLFTYQMSEIIKKELKDGIEIKGETEAYAFNLNDFFAVENGRFIHNDAVDDFLDALTTQKKFPFSTPELRDELKHTLWLLNRVESARLLARKLKLHPVFKEYEIVLAAGDGQIDDDSENELSFDKVVKAIAAHDKTITISVGQLTTGVTIPEWSAVMMLSDIQSPALYMQAAFRAQNQCLYRNGMKYARKENAYVFDFDPARTLTVFEKFANDLSPNTKDGRGDMDDRKQNIRTLLNFFPVIGEDENGEMIELDAEKVLSIPRKIRSREVVRCGFMSDFLFQNIGNIFHAPSYVVDILDKLMPVKKPTTDMPTSDTGKDLSIDENGNVDIPEEQVIGTAKELFGDKIYDIASAVKQTVDNIKQNEEGKVEEPDAIIEQLKQMVRSQAVQPILNTAQEKYGDDLSVSQKKRLEVETTSKADREINRTVGDYQIQKNLLDKEHQEYVADLKAEGKSDTEVAEADTAYKEKQVEAVEGLKQNLSNLVDNLIQTSSENIVRSIEVSKKEKERDSYESTIRDHLRGFSRTIPSFLMAYGDSSVNLATFDQIIPENVFEEVTGITLDAFRFLRDGGDHTDETTGEVSHYEGHLFDPVVFDDSIKEFMRLRTALADYFDESKKEDIFDYVPPQKTNQIFTPKWVVKKMIDELEEENPGCFDDPTKTFADLYMKSGLYITEIVKRLYNSEGLKKAYTDKNKRIHHILSEQVYGCAPSEIIYKIATNYILGFDEKMKNETKNFIEADTAELAKNGQLAKFVEDNFK